MDDDFKNAFLAYKKLIDDDIELYCKQFAGRTTDTYGEASSLVAGAYTDILKRDSKRIRGALTIVGYEMCGGKDRDMILLAARAVEMMHAYILIIDDIQDRSATRRGGPSAHVSLEAAHKSRKWKGDASHTGISLAINSALLGCHSAEMLLANLEVEQDLRVKVINIMNHTMAVTVHGQSHDIVNEVTSGKVPISEIENVLQWKTAHYSVLNPLHMGMVLAGAPCEDTNAITEYALHTGKAFQITDDLAIVSAGAGKHKLGCDDIREGKQTLLIAHALQHAAKAEISLLKTCLGNQELTENDFRKCKDILNSSGAVKYAQQAANEHISTARKSLQIHAERWNTPQVNFLDNLAQYILNRNG